MSIDRFSSDVLGVRTCIRAQPSIGRRLSLACLRYIRHIRNVGAHPKS